MRQANADPMCSTVGRGVVPACWREGSVHNPTAPPCDNSQYYALPSRRIAQVARRFDDAFRNGVVSSICRANYSVALSQIVTRIQVRLCPPG